MTDFQYASNPSAVAIVMLLYIAVTFGFAWYSNRQTSRGSFMEEYFVGGRKTGPWVLAMTWAATMTSGGLYIGVPSLAHTFGWVLLLWICGNMVVATTSFGVLARRVSEIGRKTGALTFPDLFRDRFESPALAVITSIVTLILQVSFMVAQYIAGARVLEAVIGVPYLWGVLGFSITVTIYTAWGGFRAVAWTDSFQAVVMVLGISIAAYYVVDMAGGLSAMSANLSAQSPDLVKPPGPDGFLPLAGAISFFMLMPLATMGHPALITRYLTFTGSHVLKRAMLMSGLFVLVLYPIVILVGIGGRAIVPNLASPDHAMVATVMAAVPGSLAGLVIAAPVAAIMSTLSSYLLVCSGTIVRDLYQRNFRPNLPDRQAQTYVLLTTFFISALATGFALNPPEFLQLIVVFAGTGMGATFTWPIILAIFWPRMNRTGALSGVIFGFGSFILQYAINGDVSVLGFHPFVWSFLLSLLSCVLGSFVSPRQSNELLNIYFPNKNKDAAASNAAVNLPGETLVQPE